MTSQTGLLVIYGLPGAGKTSFINRLLSSMLNDVDKQFVAIPICYDCILPQQIHFQDDNPGYKIWKNIRQLILDSIQHCECVDNNASLTWSSDPTYGQKWIDVVNMIQSYKKDSPRCLYILDDNFYYRGMRYKVYQLARKHSWGYGQVWIKCPLEIALQRNSYRANSIPQSTITKMDTNFEIANADKFPWENNNLIFDNTLENLGNWKVALDFAVNTFSMLAVSTSSTDEFQKEQDRLTCATNIIHQADHILRKLVSQSMQQFVNKVGKSSSQLAVASKKFNNIRKDIMADLRHNTELPSCYIECTDNGQLLCLLNRIYEKKFLTISLEL